MLPKIESAISFIENNPNGRVLITSLSQLDAALEGKIGTLITK
ncbi:carbamate kinase, partial [Staphylococcus equorum]